MRKSARILGQEYGLTAQEMNFVLKEEGFLDGEPGNYYVTDKGKNYAEEQDYHRGTGGYAHYNRYWTTRTWDDGITNELDFTEDRKKEIRKAISIAKQKISDLGDEDIAIECDNCGNDDADTTDANKDALVVAIGALLVAVSAYGIYKAAPYVKRWWIDKAVPGLKKMKNKVAGKAEKMEAGTGNDEVTLDSEEG
jgi:hypothetical protein